MANFQLAKEKILKIEGGYVNRSADKGGETFRGISRNANPDWAGWKIVDAFRNLPNFPASLDKHLNLLQLVDLKYKADYWDSLKLDNIIYQGVADEIFDISVNMGIVTAAHLTQHALNLMNKNQKDYKDLTEDGKLGAITIMCINATKNFQALMKALNVLQGARYAKICEADPTQEEFFVGWIMNRC